MSNISKSENKDNNEKIKKIVSKNSFNIFMFELFGSFIFILIINLGMSLGELDGKNWFLSIFHSIYNINLFATLWIGSFTFLAFLLFEKTSITSNFVTLVIQYKNKNVDKSKFLISTLGQFTGGLIASLMVYFLTMGFAIWLTPDYQTYSEFVNTSHTMGGANLYLRGILTHSSDGSYQSFNLYKPIDFSLESKKVQFEFSIIQGIVNSIVIASTFVLISISEKKYNSNISKRAIRYIILIVSILMTIILSANTTDWVRMFSPRIIGAMFIQDADSGYQIATTLVFMSFQSLGLIFILLFNNSTEKEKE